jgi:PKD repeat protein
VTIAADTTPPVATITSPLDGTTFNTNVVAFVGTVNEPVAALTVNGTPATLSAGGTSWFALVTFALPGSTGINVWSQDTVTPTANEGTQAGLISIDIVPPDFIVDITGPAGGTVYVETDIRFSATATGGVAPYDFTWDFGDASAPVSGTELRTPTHQYADPGYYLVTVRAVDDGGVLQGMDTAVVELDVVYPPLSAFFTASPAAPVVGEVITFDAGGSAGRDIRWYYWDLNGDSLWDGFSTGPIVKWSYSTAGSRTVGLRVTDKYGQVVNTSVLVNVGATRRTASLASSAETIGLIARAGTPNIATDSITITNVGPAGSIAAVAIDDVSLPSHITVSAGSYGLLDDESTDVTVSVDPSSLAGDHAFVQTYTFVITAEGSTSAPVVVELTVDYRVYGTTGGCAPAGGTSATAFAVFMVAVAAALHGRRREDVRAAPQRRVAGRNRG